MNFPHLATIPLTALLLTGCVSLFFNTAAKTPALKQRVTNKIMNMDRPADAQCQQRTIVKTEILRFYYITGISSERWTVDRCGQRVNYLVTLVPNFRGDTDILVQLEK